MIPDIYNITSQKEAKGCVLHDYFFVSNNIKIAQTEGRAVQWGENSTTGISGCTSYAEYLCSSDLISRFLGDISDNSIPDRFK